MTEVKRTPWGRLIVPCSCRPDDDYWCPSCQWQQCVDCEEHKPDVRDRSPHGDPLCGRCHAMELASEKFRYG